MTAAPAAEPAARPRPKALTVALAAASGQSIEYYDFFLYGTAATLIFGKLFFPDSNPTAANLASFATFAAGFVLRPLGGIIFGHLGDRLGRKHTLVITLLLMGGATTLIGVLPTYQSVGILAPVLLVALRCLQGISAGGEWGGAALIAVEHAPKGKGALYGAFPQMGSPIGTLLSTGAVLAVTALPDPAFYSWGWRVPFLLSAVLIAVGLLIRARLGESPEFTEAREREQEARVPLAEVFRQCGGRLVVGIAAALLTTAGFFLVNTFTISYVVDELGLDESVGLIGQIVTSVVQGALLMFVGVWAVRRPPRLIGAASALLVAAWAFPLYALMRTGAPAAVWIGQGVATLFQTGLWAVMPILLARLFPVHLRYTAVSLSYQGSTLIGGFAPLVATLLLAGTGHSPWSVAGLLCVVGVISATGALFCRPRTG